ncbi:Linear gramicidin synthase subunit B [compost metagenome]
MQESSFLRIEAGLIRRLGIPQQTVHDAFPFTITGRADGNYDEIEQAISRIWAETMHLPSVNIYSSFLDVGGDSLIATQLLRKLEIEFPGILDLPDLFTYSSVAELSGYIKQQRDRQQMKPAKSAAADQGPPTGDSLDVQLQSMMDKLTSDEQTVEDLVELLSQRRNRIDE